jgi:UDP-N-acetylglucosamine--N-acetylmuramyl-(pentapeptide) pyrophosphoryl-undecaprenol N-acetylglucosamine transferase
VTVVFAGGGTGGHLYPAIAIADALRERRAQVAFIGSADRLETAIVPRAGYALFTIAAHSLPRVPSLRIFRAIAENLRGIVQSFGLLGAARPDLVVATGGYVSFPVAVAARMRRLVRLSRAPLVLLEPNASPGLTNRLLTPIVDEVWHDVPVRASLRRLPPKEAAAARLGLDPALRTVVAVGGSQGARTINDALLRLVAGNAIPDGWQLLHVTGESDYARVGGEQAPAGARVVLRPYLEDMADAYAVADLLLTRAGASTLGELSALGKPAIVVPYPFAADGHQAENASRLEAAGAIVVLPDRDVRDGRLPAVLAATTQERRLAELRANARRMQGSDPLVGILARIDSLVPRKDER